MKGSSFHAGHEFNYPGIANIGNQAVDDLISKIPMSHLTAFEAEGSLDLIAFVQKADGLVLLRLIVVFINRNGELHLFDGDDLLLFPGGAFTLILLVEIFAVVLDLADGRNGIRGYLDQVERALSCQFQRFEGGHDAELFAVFIDNPDFTGTDTFVCTNEGLGGAFIDRWNNSPPQQAAAGLPCVSRWNSGVR